MYENLYVGHPFLVGSVLIWAIIYLTNDTFLANLILL
jgi:hypothetical protein